MDRCKREEPKVINTKMINDCINLHRPRGEAGRIQQEEGIPLEEVEQLRLEFLNILRIDHLWMLTSLTKLSLSHNLIERIENLDVLVNLKELDLSFNKIVKIENLGKLVNVEILSLFSNLITTIENLDELAKLLIFTIGQNCITDRRNVFYLRRFTHLQSVNMAGNPCADSEDFLIFVSGFLPQVTYYQYAIILESDRELGLQTFSKLHDEVLIEEAKRKAILDQIEAERAEEELHVGSFVEFLGSSYLFDQMFKDDTEGMAFLLVNSAQQGHYLDYKEQFTKFTKQIFDLGQVQYKIRKTEVDEFFATINGAKSKSQLLSIEKMEEFLLKKEDIFAKVKKLQEEIENDHCNNEQCNESLQVYSDEYNDLLHKAWKELMALELTLYEQMEEVISNFEQTITEMVNYFIENAQGYFTELRNLEQAYSENLGVEAVALLTLAGTKDDYPLPEDLKIIMSDKEILNNALGASHDAHLLAIDVREDTLVGKARSWLHNLVSGLTRQEVMRNRGKVLEINHFLDIQREEFEELHSYLTLPATLETDLNALLN
ncbi:hypothetical protein PPYR_10069 [Photinus pyralis]|uniref:Dynein axonemal assembly factor 1 homolog n=3 Tax=Photinus pyralis TaxID=7054 RepID=A0A5N4AFK0_PHOPY|nr:dynein regulatory complex subunit 3-like [Photinus pyralis]KAB0796008.1 hypothetical protein PPYR_10069 [Photinus pyralis]